MRALFKFFWRYNFFFFFLILECVCFILVVQNNYYQKASVVNSTNAIAGGIYNSFDYITDYFSLRTVNEKLNEENARLLTYITNNNLTAGYEEFVVNDSSRSMQYRYQPANVIANTVSKKSNYLTLSIGSNEGIKPEMGVISSKGAVGVVRDVSENYTSVMSLLHKDANVPAKLKKSNYSGYVIWDTGDPEYLSMKQVPLPAEIKIGDTVVTSTSAVFPEGILLGTVASHEIEPGENFYTIRVWTSVNFANVKYVHVVKNSMQKEFKSLIQKQEDKQKEDE